MFPQGLCTVTAGTLFDSENNGLGGLFKGLTLDGSVCVDAGTSWAIAIPVKPSGFWCVDSMGVSREKNVLGVAYEDANSVIGSGVCN